MSIENLMQQAQAHFDNEPDEVIQQPRSMWHERHFLMRYGFEINETESGWHVVLLEEEDGPGNGATEMGGGKFELSDEGYCEAVQVGNDWLSSPSVYEVHPLADNVPVFANDGSQPGDADPLAGLGLRAGDLEAVRDQIMEIMRPLQREFYRAQFMAAVIQGTYASGAVKRNKFEMIDDAQEIADLAIGRMGL